MCIRLLCMECDIRVKGTMNPYDDYWQKLTCTPLPLGIIDGTEPFPLKMLKVGGFNYVRYDIVGYGVVMKTTVAYESEEATEREGRIIYIQPCNGFFLDGQYQLVYDVRCVSFRDWLQALKTAVGKDIEKGNDAARLVFCQIAERLRNVLREKKRTFNKLFGVTQKNEVFFLKHTPPQSFDQSLDDLSRIAERIIQVLNQGKMYNLLLGFRSFLGHIVSGRRH